MLRFLAAILMSFALAAPAAAEKIRVAVTDIEGLEALQREFGPFGEALAGITGYEVELYPVSSRTAAVEAMVSEQVDFVLTGPAEYVVINQLTRPTIVVAWQRPEYYAQVVTLSDGPIRTVEDLRGKKVAFGSVGSTSQHLGPAQALADHGLRFGEDYDAQIISRNTAIEAMINGDIQAVGLNRSHLEKIREAYPDIAFTVIARGPDLPNDILVARKGVPDEVVARVRESFVKDGKALMSAVLKGDDNRKYTGGFFLSKVEDENYDYVRAMYRTIGVNSFDGFVGN